MLQHALPRSLPRSDVAARVLVPALDRIRAELHVPPSFPPEVRRQALRAVHQWRAYVAATRIPDPVPSLDMDLDEDDIQALYPFRRPRPPEGQDIWEGLDESALPHLDGTHIPFVTVDPPGSRDLDQAMHLLRLPPGEPDGAAYLVTYAIASLATFIPPESPLDREARERGLTTYLPDEPTPLHPPTLSEGAASLLPGQKSPACVWHIRLGPGGERISWRVRRAIVVSRAQLTYEELQEALAAIDEGDAPALPFRVPGDLPVLLREIGRLRLAREAARGGVSARIPEQEIARIDGDPPGRRHRRYRLVYRSNLPVEEWNAQISLLTGMCAASVMREAGIGILRTVPPATPSSMVRLRTVARALGVDWPAGEPYPDLVRELDPGIARHAAFLLEATSLFRGAGYAVYGVGDRPSFPAEGAPETRHAAIAAEYAHATAPLRRLADRWALEICLAACEGRESAEWVRASLGDVPSLMGRATQRVGAAERESLAAIEALLLADQVGEPFSGAVVDLERRRNGTVSRGTVMIADPAVMAPVYAAGPAEVETEARGAGPGAGEAPMEDPLAGLALGEIVDVRLASADVERRRIRFEWPVDAAAAADDPGDQAAG